MLSSLELGSRLRDAREARQLSCRAVGRLAACSDSHIRRVEQGKVTPSLKHFCLLVQVLAVSPCTLLHGMWETADPTEEDPHGP